jgi:hypothetical protein
MPLIKVYIIDSDPYGLKGHSIFKSVCNNRSFMIRNLQPSHTTSFSRKPLLPERPSATKHRPNSLDQPTQDIHGHMVKKLEKGETAACVKLHKNEFLRQHEKQTTRTRTKVKIQVLMLFALVIFLCPPRAKRRGKRRYFKCKELGHFIASCPHMDIEDEVRRCFTYNKKDHMIPSYPSHEESRLCFPHDDSHQEEE